MVVLVRIITFVSFYTMVKNYLTKIISFATIEKVRNKNFDVKRKDLGTKILIHVFHFFACPKPEVLTEKPLFHW